MSKFRTLVKKWWQGLAVLAIVGLTAAILWWWPVPQPPKASFILQPASQTVKAGQQLVVKVEVQSSSPANAVDVTLHYPKDRLEVVSSSSKQSRFDMVLFPAAINKSAATVRFLQATVVPFSGLSQQGLVGTVTFKAKLDGQVNFSTTGKVVANNSQGSDLTAKVPDKPLWRSLLNK
jgi:hypothetical protein